MPGKGIEPLPSVKWVTPSDGNLFRELAAYADEGMVAVDSSFRILFANLAFARMLDYPPDHLVGRAVEEFISPADRPFLSPIFLKQGETIPFQFETRFRKRDGAEVSVALKGIFRHRVGGLLAGIGVVTDLTAQKHAEKSFKTVSHEVEQQVNSRTMDLERLNSLLAFSEARYRGVVEDQTELIYRWLPDGRLTFVNSAFCRFFGKQPDELIGQPFWQTFFPETNLLIAQAVGSIDPQNQVVAYEHRIRISNGAARWLQWTTRGFFDAEGRVIEYQSVGRDITPVKDAETRYREEARRAQALARTAEKLNAELALPQVLDVVCRELAELLAVPVSGLLLYNPKEDVFYNAALYGIDADLPRLHKGIPRQSLEAFFQQTGQVAVIPDLAAFRQSVISAPYVEFGFRSVASIALCRHEVIVGALSVATLAHCREFTEEDIELLKAFAAQALIAIANAQLFSQVTASRERLTDLSRQLVAAQEAERRAIARELHDEIGQVLTSLKLLIETSRHKGGSEYEATVITQSLALTQQLIDRVRDLSLNLRPSMLDDLGLLPTLIHHIERYSSQTGVSVDFRHNGLERRFSMEVETSVYRIVQEGLTNIARHALVKDAVVRIWCTGEMLGVQIEDAGSGFDSEKVFNSGQANGLSGMRERVELLRGQLLIESEVGRGTRLTAELPLVEFVERRQYDRLDFAG